MKFLFDPKHHTYFLGSREIPSVTDILRDTGLLFYSTTNRIQKARGSYVHKATELIDIDMLEWDSLDRALRPYCEAYKQFLTKTRFDPLMSERSLYHPDLRYAGTIDRIGMLDGSNVIIDLKTGSPHPATDIQLAAYNELIRPHLQVDRCFALYLSGAGRYSLVETRDLDRNFEVFRAALSIFRWKKDKL